MAKELPPGLTNYEARVRKPRPKAPVPPLSTADLANQVQLAAGLNVEMLAQELNHYLVTLREASQAEKTFYVLDRGKVVGERHSPDHITRTKAAGEALKFLSGIAGLVRRQAPASEPPAATNVTINLPWLQDLAQNPPPRSVAATRIGDLPGASLPPAPSAPDSLLPPGE